MAFATTPSNKPKPCYLLALPAELRLDIYEYFFPSQITLGLSFETYLVVHSIPNNSISLASYTALIRTNQELHAEVSKAFYAYTKFRITPWASFLMLGPSVATPRMRAPDFPVRNAEVFKRITKVEFAMGEYGHQLRGCVAAILALSDGCSGVKDLKIDVDIHRLVDERADELLDVFKVIKCAGKIKLELADGIHGQYSGKSFEELRQVLQTSKTLPEVYDSVTRTKVLICEN